MVLRESQYLVLHTGNRVYAVLGTRVFEHLVDLPARYFEHRPTGTIGARLHGVETIRVFVSGAAVSLLLDLPFLAIFLALMFWYSWQLTLITLAILAALVTMSVLIVPLIRARLNEQFLLGARNQAFLTEYVAGMETVKSLQMEPQLKARYGDYLGSYLVAGFNTRQLSNTYSIVANALEDYKIKLAGDAGRDRANLAVLLSAGVAPERVRVDGNNLWSDLDVARDYIRSLEHPFAAIEEPLRPGQFADLATLAESLATRIVLDESIVRESQLSPLPGKPDRWIVNLRVSKMGGLLRSLAVARRCREMGLSLIVGAQVGETSLLTRAALIVAQAARDIVIGQEGAFGTMLLESDAMQPTLMFGAKGELDIHSLGIDRSLGFGLAPVPDLAERYQTSPLDTTISPDRNSRVIG